jgi:hypothetical protein
MLNIFSGVKKSIMISISIEFVFSSKRLTNTWTIKALLEVLLLPFSNGDTIVSIMIMSKILLNEIIELSSVVLLHKFNNPPMA